MLENGETTTNDDIHVTTNTGSSSTCDQQKICAVLGHKPSNSAKQKFLDQLHKNNVFLRVH